MALRQPTPEPDDPRLEQHRTDYSASRGGWVKPEPKPTPGAGNGSNGRLSKGSR
ncbi:hypothetical protein [Streptomyces virginiae]|uniref:Uncharacterized protein n=1 Tax=Streptomyces virginiae TaxID=1961 RepID=A0ABZ1TSU9_STRVG|nr:hypothetical protein [Streptomyces virginiae]